MVEGFLARVLFFFFGRKIGNQKIKNGGVRGLELWISCVLDTDATRLMPFLCLVERLDPLGCCMEYEKKEKKRNQRMFFLFSQLLFRSGERRD